MVLPYTVGTDELRFYGSRLSAFQIIIDEIIEAAEASGYVEHTKARIKSLDSVKAKLSKKGLNFPKKTLFSIFMTLRGFGLSANMPTKSKSFFFVIRTIPTLKLSEPKTT